MDWYLAALKKYAEFGGRARRKEYWFFFLFNFLISLGLAIIDHRTGTYDPQWGVGFLGRLYALCVILPSLAVAVRRLHDTGRSGWWMLLLFVPVAGPVVILVFLVLDGDPGANAYGPDPKAAGEGP